MTTSALPVTVRLVAVLIGISVPCLVFGRVIMAVPLILAVLVLAGLHERSRYWQALKDQVRGPIGVMVLVMLVLWLPGSAVSPMPIRSLEAWVRIPVFLGMAVYLWAMLRHRRDGLDLALKALLVAGALTTAFAAIALTVPPTEFVAFVRLKGWNADAVRPPEVFKEFGTTAILLLPALLWAGWRLGGRWWGMAVATSVGLLAAVWLTYNRSAMSGVLAMAVLAAGLITFQRRNLKLGLVVSAALAAVVFGILLWLYQTRGGHQIPDGAVTVLPHWLLDYQRQTIWAHAIDIGMRSPWIGNGINVVNLLPGADLRLTGNNLNIIPAHPHNWLIEVFVETGAVGAFALLTLVLTACLKLAGDFIASRDTAVLAALMVNVGYWSSGLLNVSFWSAWWQVSYLLLTALCLAGRERPVEHPPSANRTVPSSAMEMNPNSQP